MRHDKVNDKLEARRQILESKGFKLSSTKIKYLKYKFSVTMNEAGMEVKLSTLPIPKRESLKCLGVHHP